MKEHSSCFKNSNMKRAYLDKNMTMCYNNTLQDRRNKVHLSP